LLHEGIICARSEFFRRALGGNWAEREDRLVRFPEDCPKVFGIYVNFVYTNEISAATELPAGEYAKVIQLDNEYLALSKLYVLCEKLQDTRAKNAITRAFIANSAKKDEQGIWYVPSPSMVNILYDGTSCGSPA
jgi:hypothetical protein